jgi:dethiobiotin synthetase
MSAVFVTATGTEVGKTFVTCGLIRCQRSQGRTVAALKPVASGFDPARPAGSDSAILLTALGLAPTPENIAEVSPWRFAAPLSPDMAARREGRAIDFSALVEFCASRIATGQRLVIEGIGGLMVPLDDRHTVLDWMVALDIPVVLVAGSYLGSLSHTLTALDVLAARDRRLAAVVVSESADSSVTREDTLDSLRRFVSGIDLVALPRLATDGLDHPAFARIADAAFAG